jgi:hypothetical protein
MEFVPLLVIGSLIKKAVDLLKYVTNQDWNAAATQLVTWAAGIGLAFLLANSDFADGLAVNGQTLASLNAFSIVLVGLAVSSTASTAVDTLKAIDGSQSASMPALFRPAGGAAPPPAE